MVIVNNTLPSVTVVLTSIRQRITTLDKVISSLHNQLVKPDKIILYLSQSPYLIDTGISFYDTSLLKIINFPLLEIRWVDNIGPYRKSIFYIRDHLLYNQSSSTLFITVDDDTLYPDYFIQLLLETYMTYQCVIAYRGRNIVVNDQQIAPYNHWQKGSNSPSFANLPTGKDGILYSLDFFDHTVIDIDAALKIAPTSDDLWLKWHYSLKGIKALIINPSACLTIENSFPLVNRDKRKKNPSLFRHYNKGEHANNNQAINELEKYSQNSAGTTLHQIILRDTPCCDNKLYSYLNPTKKPDKIKSSRWFPIIQSFNFYHFFYRGRFAEALANQPAIMPGNRLENYILWANYRLNRYKTIAFTPIHCHLMTASIIARAVSLAACGLHNEARQIVLLNIKKQTLNLQQREKLAQALAPYLPDLALFIIEHDQVAPALKIALLLKNGQKKQAEELLKTAINDQSERHHPELYLHKSNIQLLSPLQKINLLNHYFSLFQLSAIKLSHALLPPATNNLCSSIELKSHEGPLVSILMTAYQVEHYITAAITSLQQQSYFNIEIIVINDASVDSTEKLILKLAKQDSRIKSIALPYNIGTYAAKNIALHYAKGEFITCQDADDWAHPLKIEKQLSPLLKNKNLICTTSQWIRIQHDGLFTSQRLYPLLRLNPASPLFRREIVLQQAGCWDWVRTGADSEFIARLKLIFGHASICCLKLPLTLGAHRPNSLMTAEATGYSENRMPPDRLEYWESWNRWHIEQLRQGVKPRLSENAFTARPFSVPENIQVNSQDLLYCMQYLGLDNNR